MSTPARRAMRFSWELVEVWSRIGARASTRGVPSEEALILLSVRIELWNPGCREPRHASALALLVTRVALADHHDAAVAADDLAVVADGLDGGVDLHDLLFAVFGRHAEAWGFASRPVER